MTRTIELRYDPDTDVLTAASDIGPGDSRWVISEDLEVVVDADRRCLTRMRIERFSRFTDFHTLWQLVDDVIMQKISEFQIDILDHGGNPRASFEAPVTKRERREVSRLDQRGLARA